MTDHVTVSAENGIQKLVINRADKKNALTQDMYAVLSDSLNAAETDPKIRVTVITGVADSFTSGNDLMDFLQNPAQDETTPVIRFLHSLANIRKPLIAAVNGLAVGVGTTMLLHCDLVYASDNATFTLPFVNLALVPEASSSYLLPKMLGHQRAAELLMLGEKFSSSKAAQFGIVNEVVSPDKLEETAMAAAAKLAAKAPEALRLTKALIKGDHEAILNRMNAEGEVFQSRLTSPEAREAMTAFMEKRAPDFSKFS
ncbi:crotonase/enoyl-CoA hydratase family protein [Sneathiella limimaris]|uniref:crotonase/enoyl-CoA hydratase family protein n=1 Tax=Sneathiella limimaris TaxID=1964213 RepID=UPI00146E904A|nr:crotonase/enoyl-CoA hydratase family protein [Sneathiella limimaris]